MDLPMFPLGSVLFPGQLLPLHIFEQRYQDMLQHCLSSSREFGVVLIERGHEVGGGDLRSQIGTVAKILQCEQAETGHWAVISVGTRRVRVDRWHRDEPWPHADVHDLTDDAAADDPDSWKALRRQFRRLSALIAEVDDSPYPVDVQISDEPGLGTFHIAALSPLGSFDRQKVLATTSLADRVALLATLLTESAEIFEAAMRMGDQPEAG